MEIKQLLDCPVGYKTGGFSLTIKTIKKRWQVDESWIHQVLLTDITGDILTDIVCETNIPFQRTAELYIVVCEIQAAETGKKLVVHEWRQESMTEPPVWVANEPESVVRSKVRCRLVCAYIISGTEPHQDEVRYWTDFIVTGK